MVWDTNAIIFFLQDLLPQRSKDFLLQELKQNTPHFSIISEIELLSWPKLSKPESQTIADFLSHFERIELTEEIKLETIRIRRTIGLKVPDSIIAASALTFQTQLLSNNFKDFTRVPHLELIDPLNITSV